MSFFSNLPQEVQVGEKHRRRTQHDNKKKNQGTITAENEDDTDSTVTKTTVNFTTSCESEWDEYTIDGTMEPSSLSDHAYGFRRRRWVKPLTWNAAQEVTKTKGSLPALQNYLATKKLLKPK